MSLLDGYDEEVVVVHGQNLGSLAGFVVEGPSGHGLGLVYGAVVGSGLRDGQAVGVNLGGIYSLLVAFVRACGEGCEGVGLCVVAVEGLLACDGGLLKHCYLLLSNGLAGPGHEHHVGSVCACKRERLAYLSLEYGLHTGNHIVLGHPADSSELSVISGILVEGVLGCEVGE